MQLRKGCRFWWILIPGIALDRITKHAAAEYLASRAVRPFLPGIISWVYTENRGAAFSILSGRSMLLILLTIALVAALAVYLLGHPDAPVPERIGLWCIIAGGLGNLWDRILYGYVIDFIRLDFIRFPIFNAADILVCAGAAAVVFSALQTELRRKKHG